MNSNNKLKEKKSSFDEQGFFDVSLETLIDTEENAEEIMFLHQTYVKVIQEQSYATRGYMLLCQYGSKAVFMDCITDYGIYQGTSPVMTCIDCKPCNIHDFGSCRCQEANYKDRLPMTPDHWPNGEKARKMYGNERAHICIPLIDEEHGWLQTDKDILAKVHAKTEYSPLLMDNAVLVCLYGGIIYFTVQPGKVIENCTDNKKREIIFPSSVSGKLDGKHMTLSPNDKWYSFLSGESGVSKDGNKYKIAVGPKILDPDYDDGGRLLDTDFSEIISKVRIFVELIHKETKESKTIECVVVDVKAHTYNIHPDTAPEHSHILYNYNKNITASFDIENGYIQTGIAYPNRAGQKDSKDDGPIATGHMDGSVIEFYGTATDFGANNYNLVKVIVKDEF